LESLVSKMRISVLWFFVVVSDLANVLMSLAYPGVMEELMTAGESMGPELMFAGAIVILIPLVMAVLTLTLKDSMNRWLNIILGLVFTVIYFGNFVELSTTMPAAYILLLSIAGFIAPALIVWYAWKWPKQEA
jgi:drug/metabolite transporter (DMT)-like permease